MLQGTIVNNSTDFSGAEPYYDDQVTQNIEDDTESFTQQFSKLFDSFAQSIPNGSHQEKSAKNFFNKFGEYVGSNKFKSDLEEKSQKYAIPKKQLAKNFFLKVLGIIGDILGIVVNTVTNVLDLAVTLLSNLLHGGIDIINKVANGIVGVITCNQTNIA